MHNGWIKLHRKLLEKGFYKKSTYVHLWVHLLLSANHATNEFMWNGSIILVKEGQLITGRDQLSKSTGIHRSSIERILKMLEIEQQIEQQKTTKYRLITIVNWDSYQKADSITSNKRATSEQQASTNKNDKKVKNDKKETITKEIGETSSPRKVKFPNSTQIFRLWGSFPASWAYNTTERRAAENLFRERGADKVILALLYYEKYKDEEMCPAILKPSDLDRKWENLRNFRDKRK